MDGWFSDSLQALIFKRRQTQHRSSEENGATTPPQMTHLPGLGALFGVAIGAFRLPAGRFADLASTTLGFFRFMVSSPSGLCL